ncbi:hypothetical protein EES45_22875 [Streptomyces sp. ADI97-07]|uniref:hypothetical protein n=1 Tax=Streptomyces sp. ADI97-07 TaxID=1522762 RepID=UPI000F54D6D4|nr:hypothetical protein [Streptomyces sp. ADI97-07]RPK76606.1 hypothetical protein EES45_22875 [Streptomyces sp. ADI97-07]
MATTDNYGQGVSVAALTDPPDAEVLAKALANGIVSRSVLRFTSATARTAALTGPSAPVEGMMSTLADTDRVYRYNGSAWVPLSPVVQANSTNFSFTSQKSFSKTVTFPSAFPSAPYMTANIALGAGETAGWTARAISITPTQCVLFVEQADAARPADTWSNIPVHWIGVAS